MPSKKVLILSIMIQYLTINAFTESQSNNLGRSGSRAKELVLHDQSNSDLFSSEESFSKSLNVNIIRQSKGEETSTITCNISRDSITFGELITISGQILPSDNLNNAVVRIYLTKYYDYTINKTTTANQEGQYTYHVACNDIPEAGLWVIEARWDGNENYSPASSNELDLMIDRADTYISLELSSDVVKAGDKISIFGNFNPSPYCSSGLTGRRILLFIDSRSYFVETNADGHFQLTDHQVPTEPGYYKAQAMFNEDQSYNSSSSSMKSFSVVESAGYAIIVQGQSATGEGAASGNKTTLFVRDQLESIGIMDNEAVNDIIYFRSDNSHSKVDAKPSRQVIRETIVQWASERMNQAPANLYIVMVNHGQDEQFFIDPEVITSQDLKQWLDELQHALNAQAQAYQIVLVLGFNHSGSFIDDLSGQHRIIITSASAGEYAFKGPLDDDNIRNGDYFVYNFFANIAPGKSIKQSFGESVFSIETFAQYNKMGRINIPPYFDRSEQHPLLDDNGDGIGCNNIFESSTDGETSEEIFIGYGIGNSPDVALTSVAPDLFLDHNNKLPDTPFWAKVDNMSRLKNIWIEVKAPEYDVESSGTDQKAMVLPKIMGEYNDQTNQLEWHKKEILALEDFLKAGQYQVFYFAKDINTNNVAPFMETKVYRNTSGNQNPSDFQLLTPENGAILTHHGFLMNASTESSALFSWTSSIDTDNEEITYSIVLSRKDDTFSGELYIIDNDIHTIAPIDLPNTWDGQTIYWKVRALDPKGAFSETETYQLQIDNFAGIPVGRIRGYVCDSITGKVLKNASLHINNQDIPLSNGYYVASKIPTTYPIIVSCPEYAVYESTVTIDTGKTFFNLILLQKQTLIGDIDGNNMVNLTDAILALKIIGDIKVFDNINLSADIDGDGQIGEVEVIYILRKTGRFDK